VDFTALTDALNNFITALGAGQERANSMGGGLVNALLVIEVCLFGLAMAHGTTQLWDVIRRVLAVGTWLYIVKHFGALAKMFVDSVVTAGLIAGGRDGDIAIIRDPSQIATMFLDVSDPIANKFEHLRWDIAEKLTMGFVWMLLALPFLAMACAMFSAVVDYYLVRLLATVLIPFSLNQHTRFLAEKGINGVIAAGLKLMVLSCILAIAQPVLKAVKIDANFNWNQLWALFFTAGACGWVVWTAPRSASTLLFGSPGLSAVPLAGIAGAAAAKLVSSAATSVANYLQQKPPEKPPANNPQNPSTNNPTPPPSSRSSRPTTAPPPSASNATSGGGGSSGGSSRGGGGGGGGGGG
jgi:type IV secretion system protein TrbL